MVRAATCTSRHYRPVNVGDLTGGSSGGLPVLQNELEAEEAVPFRDFGSIQRPYGRRQRTGLAEGDRLEPLALARQRQPEMPLADHALRIDGELVVERGRCEALAPDALPQLAREGEGQLAPG